MKRALFAGLGTVCVGAGCVGIVVPGLPTTVFLLLAAWFFARSSPRLHRRLTDHPRLGPYLRYAARGEMPRRAKLVSLVAMWGGILTSCALLSGVSPAAQAAVLLAGAVGSWVVLCRVATAAA